MSKYFNENKGGEIIESFYETGEINETYNSLINNVEVFLLYGMVWYVYLDGIDPPSRSSLPFMTSSLFWVEKSYINK